jgi:hypothetical protein
MLLLLIVWDCCFGNVWRRVISGIAVCPVANKEYGKQKVEAALEEMTSAILDGTRQTTARKGCTKAMMLAHGFSTDMLLDLVKAGLATASTERMGTGGRRTDVTHVRISEAGQRALATMSK